MISTEAGLKKLIANKHILLDTGVFSRAFDHYSSFEDFFRLLQDAPCSAVYFPLIEFELLRHVFIPEHRESRRKFLNTINAIGLNIHPGLFDDALRIANCYAQRKVTSPSLVDCSIAAYLKRYSSNMFFATFNHKDFPTFLFSRVGVLPIETDKEVFTLGFYCFDEKKAKEIAII